MDKYLYKVDFVAKTITITAECAEKMNDPNTTEYKAIRQLCADFPAVKIVKRTHRTPRKYVSKSTGEKFNCNQFKNLTYENMEAFISGLPLALQECLTQGSFLALCAFVNRLGLEASSGYGVACKLVSFAMLIPSALMQSMASFVSQNIGAGNRKRAKQSMFTGIGVGLIFGCIVFVLVLLKGDLLAGIFSAEEAVVQNAFAYLKGFAPETILTAVLFSMIGYFNGNSQTLWVMLQGLFQTLLVRLPLAYYMSIQPDASLTNIGLSAPIATAFGIVLNIIFFIFTEKKASKKH